MTSTAEWSRNRQATGGVTLRRRTAREVLAPLRTPTRVPPGGQHRTLHPDDHHLRTPVLNHTGRPLIVALSGDPNPTSGPTRLLARSSDVAPDTVVVNHQLSLGDLPPRDETTAGERPPQVTRLEEELTRAAGLILATPPVTGSVAEPVRRLVEWLAGSAVLEGMPTAVLSTAVVPDAHLAHAALIDALMAQGAHVVSRACLAVPGTDQAFNEAGELVQPFVMDTLEVALAFLVEAIVGSSGR
jgi:NAD(P)H-dependent FMN reductase